ncbi:hypothetical protein EDD86DRAFT_197531 [Gorgonomyces haynaldii]|nr:hypothetical protein EDD86DRAFT_197531 [Gorgonomyces haynaldii]
MQGAKSHKTSPKKSPSKIAIASYDEEEMRSLDLSVYQSLCVELKSGYGLPEFGQVSVEELREMYSLDDDETEQVSEFMQYLSQVPDHVRGRMILWQNTIQVHTLREFSDKLEDIDELGADQKYQEYRKIADIIESIGADLTLDPVFEDFVNTQAFQDVIIALKCMQFSSKMAAGIKRSEGEYRNYAFKSATELVESTFSTNAFKTILNPTAFEALEQAMGERKQVILKAVKAKEVENYFLLFEDVQALIAEVYDAAFDANNEKGYPDLLEFFPEKKIQPREEKEEIPVPSSTDGSPSKKFKYNEHVGPIVVEKLDTNAVSEIRQIRKPPVLKPRTPWTNGEDEILRQAIITYGTSWSTIRDQKPELGRTNVQIKDRVRSIEKALASRGMTLDQWLQGKALVVLNKE